MRKEMAPLVISLCVYWVPFVISVRLLAMFHAEGGVLWDFPSLLSLFPLKVF